MRILIIGSNYATDEHISKAAQLILANTNPNEQHTLVTTENPGFGQVASYLHDTYTNFHTETHIIDQHKPSAIQDVLNLGGDMCYAFFIDGLTSKTTTQYANATRNIGIPTVNIVFEP